MVNSILGVIGLGLLFLLRWIGRHPKAGVDPKMTEALRIRELINEQTNRALLKLQDRKIEDLQRDLDSAVDKLDSILYQKTDLPPK